jgi:hypothetical protein
MNKIIPAILLSWCPLVAICQFQPIGATTVGQTVTYYFEDDVLYMTHEWSCTNGTATNFQRSGITYSGDITFSTAGTATITFKGDGIVRATMTVTVNGCTTVAEAPTGLTFTVSSNECGDKTITRSGGSPPDGVGWYWQSGSLGRSTSSSGPTHTVTTTGTYYLRAKAFCNATFSSAAVPTGGIYVEVKPRPAAPAPTVSVSTNSCGPKTITLTNAGSIPANVGWYWQGTSSDNQLNNGTQYNAASNTYLAGVHGSITYYIRAFGTNGCWSLASTPITPPITVDNPPAPNPYYYSVCEWENMTLTPTGYLSNVKWYSSTDQFLHLGTTYTPPNLGLRSKA